MTFYETYSEQLEVVRRECARVIGSFYQAVGPCLGFHGTAPGLQDRYGYSVDKLAARARYHDFPFLFLSYFGTPSPLRLRDLAVAGQLYAECIISLDKLMDAQIPTGSMEFHLALLGSQFRLREALGRFHGLFEPSSEFWSQLDRYSTEHSCAVMLEKSKHDHLFTHYSAAEMRRIASGKQALAKTIPAALALLGTENADPGLILDSLDNYAIACQLRDDLVDWRRDYEARRYSYLLSRVLEAAGVEGPECELATEEVGRRLHFSGLIGAYLEEASGYIDRAIRVLGGAHCPDWIAHVGGMGTALQGLSKDLRDVTQWLVKKTAVVKESSIDGDSARAGLAIDLTPCNVRHAASRGLAFLLAQQKQDYPEAQHLEFARRDGAPLEAGYCRWGGVFSRALLLDALIAAQVAGLLADQGVIPEEVDKLLADKLASSRTGWRYFPEIATLPADSDDLGQIAQVLAKAGKGEARSVCEEPLHLLLEHNQRPDGAFDTWLADPRDPLSVENKRKMLVCWGDRPDPEVVANALYGLYTYDAHRFEQAIRRGVDYLERCQEAEGYWESSWYCGKYYGTYVGSRILALVKPESPSLGTAVRFLARSQNDDGGWGDPESTPIDTAFGLLTYLAIPSRSGAPDGFQGAIRFLLKAQGAGGNWPPSDFIKIDLFRSLMRPGSGQKGALGKPVTFASSTITTGFCVKALLAVEDSLLRAAQPRHGLMQPEASGCP